MKIVVLAGGLSPERDVSLSTGTLVTNALRDKGHEAILVDLFFGMDALYEPIQAMFSSEGRLSPYRVPEAEPDFAKIRAARKNGFSNSVGNGVLELCRAADLCFLALHGGDGENGRLQAFLDLADVKYTGSPSVGCALAMNKAVSKSLFRASGVPTADWRSVTRIDDPETFDFPVPCVVKPVCGGSSLGVTIVRERALLADAIREGFQYEDELIVERYIGGMELSVGVIGNHLDGSAHALPPIEIVPKHGFYDYQHKYQAGWTDEIVPARISAEATARVQALALMAYRALKLDVYARIDFLLPEDGEPCCLEANTLPGMTPTSLLPQEAAVTGLDYPSLCDAIVRLSLKKYERA